ncbi:hypothetical protein PtA15_11A313 [Puccinia triticina]|uniref:Bromo domain-containing protein n=1 Tax=Puccinia triticina TaxID=208348 RepID=A0ABY7CZ70_9BASI|nr:uncharacterized protein PtA15_11A313 [Puccinia triticina]WAQ89623.1 hypothetical protein PtA15_11A313 [Puccinia triticina]
MDPAILIHAVTNAQALVKHSARLTPTSAFPRHHQLGCAVVICACFESQTETDILASVFRKPAALNYQTLFNAIQEPRSLEAVRYGSAKAFYIDLKSVYSTLAVLSQIAPGIWKAAKTMDSFTDDAWMTVVSLQAEKVENGELENPLPDAHQLFATPDAADDPRPPCLADTPVEAVLESLSGRLTAAARAQLPSNRTGEGPPRLALALPTSTADALADDPEIEVLYPPAASLKRLRTPERCPHPPSPSSLDTLLPPSATKRARLEHDHGVDELGWLRPQTLKQALHAPLEGLRRTMADAPEQLSSLRLLDGAIHALILAAKRVPKPIKAEEPEGDAAGDRATAKRARLCLQRIYHEIHALDFAHYCSAMTAPPTAEETANDAAIHAAHLAAFARTMRRKVRAHVRILLPPTPASGPTPSPLTEEREGSTADAERDWVVQQLVVAEREESRRSSSASHPADAEDDEPGAAKLRTQILNAFVSPAGAGVPGTAPLACLRFKTLAVRVGSWVRIFDPARPSKPVAVVVVARFLRAADVPTDTGHRPLAKELFRAVLDCCAVLHIDDYLRARPTDEAGLSTTHVCRYGYNPILHQLTRLSAAEFTQLPLQKPPARAGARAKPADDARFAFPRAMSDPLGVPGSHHHQLRADPSTALPRRASEFNPRTTTSMEVPSPISLLDPCLTEPPSAPPPPPTAADIPVPHTADPPLLPSFHTAQDARQAPVPYPRPTPAPAAAKQQYALLDRQYVPNNQQRAAGQQAGVGSFGQRPQQAQTPQHSPLQVHIPLQQPGPPGQHQTTAQQFDLRQGLHYSPRSNHVQNSPSAGQLTSPRLPLGTPKLSPHPHPGSSYPAGVNGAVNGKEPSQFESRAGSQVLNSSPTGPTREPTQSVSSPTLGPPYPRGSQQAQIGRYMLGSAPAPGTDPTVKWLTSLLDYAPPGEPAEIPLSWIYAEFQKHCARVGADAGLSMPALADKILAAFSRSPSLPPATLANSNSTNPVIRGLRPRPHPPPPSAGYPRQQVDGPSSTPTMQHESWPRIRNESVLSVNEEHRSLRETLRHEIYQEFATSYHQSLEHQLERQQKEIEIMKADLQWIKGFLVSQSKTQKQTASAEHQLLTTVQQQVQSQASLLQQALQAPTAPVSGPGKHPSAQGFPQLATPHHPSPDTLKQNHHQQQHSLAPDRPSSFAHFPH